ncbi:proline-rich protein 36-like isoform X1 [Iris pallida]|uniref:Proline-rich protein 36-like isoform X1 n=1 Tax=Iris pallida TaxID=29817 RepID=A0AAX6DRJ1_IRIPA|nr:proline-rich protein 36-like isoform X1 [Iris pallida]
MAADAGLLTMVAAAESQGVLPVDRGLVRVVSAEVSLALHGEVLDGRRNEDLITSQRVSDATTGVVPEPSILGVNPSPGLLAEVSCSLGPGPSRREGLLGSISGVVVIGSGECSLVSGVSKVLGEAQGRIVSCRVEGAEDCQQVSLGKSGSLLAQQDGCIIAGIEGATTHGGLAKRGEGQQHQQAGSSVQQRRALNQGLLVSESDYGSRHLG